MHETHLIQPIVKNIADHAAAEGAKAVTKIRLKVGQLLGVKEESFRETFAVLVKGSLLEKAQLELTFFPGTRVEVMAHEPFEGPIRVRVAGQERSLGRGLAEIVRVKLQTDANDGGASEATDN